MAKKKSPITEMFEVTYALLEQIDEKAMNRAQYVKLLRLVRCNLEKAWKEGLVANVHLAQALGAVKGALSGLGESPEEGN